MNPARTRAALDEALAQVVADLLVSAWRADEAAVQRAPVTAPGRAADDVSPPSAAVQRTRPDSQGHSARAS